MLIEHIGFSVADPLLMADWYVSHLGCKIVRKIHKSDKADAVFITDSDSRTVLELFSEPGVEAITKSISHPSQLHLAFSCDDPRAECEKLAGAGAMFVEETKASPDDVLLYLRDPWGNVIQLVKRKTPLM